MDNNLQRLRDIGAQKIHGDTHISREFAQALIHESFEDLQSVQFFGFVSIIEKTYGLDLEELKVKATEYFQEEAKFDEEKKVFIVAKKKKNNTVLSSFIFILIFSSFVYYTFIYLNSLEEMAVIIDNTKIEDAHKKVEMLPKNDLALVVDQNETKDLLGGDDKNITQELLKLKSLDINMSKQIDASQVIHSLKILPKNKLWIGYIDIQTNQKYQKTLKNKFSLDTSKNWLLLFGKGTTKLEINGEVKVFKSDQNMRFKYVNGKFQKITIIEFKDLNKGHKW